MTDTRSATTRRSAASPPGSSRGRPDRAAAGSWPVRERSLIKAVLGVPPWTAVALAVVTTAVGVAVDLFRIGTVGAVFEIAYGVGCLVAVAWVRRRSLFLPAIQPPLLLAVVVPLLAVLIGAPSESAGLTEHLLLAGAPLINAFPAMAVTTVLVLLVAGFRLVRQRTGQDDAIGLLRARLSGRGAGRTGDGRTSDEDRAAADRAAADGPTGRTRGRGADRGGSRGADRDRDGARGADRGADRGHDRSGTRTTARPAARTSDRGTTADHPDRSGRPARRRSPAGSTDARDRSDRSGGATRSGRGRAGGTRSSRPDDAAEPTRGDDRSSDPGRRGSSGSGRSGAGRPARGSGSGPSSANGGRTRRPRPSDPA